VPGSFDLDFLPAQSAGQALPIVVCLYTPGGVAESPYTILPNVRCLRIDYREGPEPPTARFQYLTADLLADNLGWPAQFESLWPIDAEGDYVVTMDDRLVVFTYDPQGDPQVLFDGFAQVPQVDLTATTQAVTFAAVGAAVRLWDIPITGRVQRNASNPLITDGSNDVPVDLPTRFNPSTNTVGAYAGYAGNMVNDQLFTVLPEWNGTGNAGGAPVFIDELVADRAFDEDAGDVLEIAYWWTSSAIKYLLAVQQSPEDEAGNPYVVYPTFDSLDAILQTYEPPDHGVLNADDAHVRETFIRDYDATNKGVVDAVGELLAYAGFVLFFETSTQDDGTPQTSLRIARRDSFAATAPKAIYLATAGTVFTPAVDTGEEPADPTLNNAAALHLARDCNSIVNAWGIETALQQFEVTVYLSPGFQPVDGDQNAPTVDNFLTTNLTGTTADQARRYRWYIADECGDGHWNSLETEWNLTEPIDFSPIFPANDDGTPSYVERYRPGARTLIARDPQGKPLKAVLEIKQGSYSADPLIGEDPTTHNTNPWLTVSNGWQLLEDRLGIRVTIQNPEDWQTGNPKLPTIRGITWQVAPTAQTAFALRLTTVIEADIRIPAFAAKRPASPTLFERRRIADAKDHFRYCVIAPNSLNYAAAGGNGTDPVIVRDDTAAAQAHVDQLRAAKEFPPLAGSVAIPFVTDYYQIADRVNIIQGRDASLQINVGADQGEAPSYPWVTAFSWVFESQRQQTVLQLSDRRAEPRNL
jgi:hypothetical protein